MFGNSPLVVDVYRQVRNRDTWGNGNAAEDADGVLVSPILAGREKVHTIYEAVIGPTASDRLRTSAEEAQMVNAKFILYTAVEEDLRQNDYVAYWGNSGKFQVLRVTGTGDLDYYSPYTDISLKETYLDVVRERRGG